MIGQLLATQVLPVVCPLLMDPFDECRAASLACVEKSCVQLKKVSDDMSAGVSQSSGEDGVPGAVPKSGTAFQC